MKEILILILLFGILFTACDTELGHHDHDHDGDGVQDHSAEEHEEDYHEEEQNKYLEEP